MDIRRYEIVPSDIEKVLIKKNYAYFKSGKPFDLNIVGIRSDNQDPDLFSDLIAVTYQDQSMKEHISIFKATTLPGVAYLQNPMNTRGCAILVPGQYRSAYKVGFHYWYKALVQRSSLRIYMDNNLDTYANYKPWTIMSGIFGINIHQAFNAKKIGKNSAGCQVIQTSTDFEHFMNLAYEQERTLSKFFTYTLLLEKDFN